MSGTSTHNDAWDEHDDPWIIEPMLTPVREHTSAADTAPMPVVPCADGHGDGWAARFVADAAAPDDDAHGDALTLEDVCEPDTSRAARMPWRVVAACAASLTLVVAGGTGAWVWHARSEAAHVHTAAIACRDVVRERGRAADRLRQAIDSDDTAKAAALDADEIMDTDATLPGALDKLLDAAPVPPTAAPSCSTSDTAALDNATVRARADRDTWTRVASDIESTRAALLDSNHARVLSDARARSDKARERARALLDSSRGKVADETVRTKLSSLLGKFPDGDAAAFDRHDKEVDAACDKVRASVKQHEQDEQERAARRQAEQERGAQSPQETAGRQSAPVPQETPVQPYTPQPAAPVQPAAPDDADRPVWSVPGPETDGALHDADPGL